MKEFKNEVSRKFGYLLFLYNKNNKKIKKEMSYYTRSNFNIIRNKMVKFLEEEWK